MSIDRDFLHDISSPLSALRVRIEMLVESAKSGDGAENLETFLKCQKLLDKCIVLIQEKKEGILLEKENG